MKGPRNPTTRRDRLGLYSESITAVSGAIPFSASALGTPFSTRLPEEGTAGDGVPSPGPRPEKEECNAYEQFWSNWADAGGGSVSSALAPGLGAQVTLTVAENGAVYRTYLIGGGLAVKASGKGWPEFLKASKLFGTSSTIPGLPSVSSGRHDAGWGFGVEVSANYVSEES